MPSAYINALQKSIEAEEPSEPLSSLTLEKRFLAWLDTRPDVSRLRPYAMSELEMAMNTQGKYLSPVLIGLGWERRRKWSIKGHYHRYWLPPSQH
jgi:hypothetical protein